MGSLSNKSVLLTFTRCYDLGAVSLLLRKFLRICIWIALGVSLLVEGALADNAISPGGCFFVVDKDGH